ncbi:MAG: type II toxin-antitoxin system mRNA interferase toxin, RelE/StbE family [Methanomicrobium sp.]|nr:type II toxin-antitoxin system mRNA interferase toxin, RelE/StbE family [Methanomicrobium sp.]MBQ4415706.1 type II toxin-antitoxin system mRNA interferase toxin, RelE/StbE family [Methanomicrobium sp.]
MIEISKSAEAFLKKNPQISESIVNKIKICLDQYLFININSCNKHELKGDCKGYWRLHVPHSHVVIYMIIGKKPDRYAKILDIMSEEQYHKWVNRS